MLEMHLKASKMVLALGFFAMNQFVFIDRNVKDLYTNMDKNDQEMFDFDVEKISWDSYCNNIVSGFGKYFPNEFPQKKRSS